MKKDTAQESRKHGYKARAAVIDRWLRLDPSESTADVHQAVAPKDRITTQLACSKTRETYFWITDRGRSRLIKH